MKRPLAPFVAALATIFALAPAAHALCGSERLARRAASAPPITLAQMDDGTQSQSPYAAPNDSDNPANGDDQNSDGDSQNANEDNGDNNDNSDQQAQQQQQPQDQSGMKVYQGPPVHPYPESAVTQRAAANDQPTIYLIALRDHTIVQALGYWMEGSTLHYVSAEHTLNQLSIDLVDRDLSQRLNDERGLDFRLPQAR